MSPFNLSKMKEVNQISKVILSTVVPQWASRMKAERSSIMKQNPDFAAIYHELSQKYGQMMTLPEVSQELHIKSRKTVFNRIPDGWVGNGPGLRIKTVSFSRQLADLE